jgi:hypothetical protein
MQQGTPRVCQKETDIMKIHGNQKKRMNRDAAFECSTAELARMALRKRRRRNSQNRPQSEGQEPGTHTLEVEGRAESEG